MLFGRHARVPVVTRIAQLLKAIRPILNQALVGHGCTVGIEYTRKQVMVGAGIVEAVRRIPRAQIEITRPLRHRSQVTGVWVPRSVVCGEQIEQAEDNLPLRVVWALFGTLNTDIERLNPFS